MPTRQFAHGYVEITSHQGADQQQIGGAGADAEAGIGIFQHPDLKQDDQKGEDQQEQREKGQREGKVK